MYKRQGITYGELAKELNQKLGKQALLAVVDGVNKDLTDTIEKDAVVEFVTPESKEGLHAIRHTASHVMAQAIQHLFPDVKFAIGPAIDNGFYYDLDSSHVFTPDDLRSIEDVYKRQAQHSALQSFTVAVFTVRRVVATTLKFG